MTNYMSNDPRHGKKQLELLAEIGQQLMVMNNLKLVYLYAAFGQEVIDQLIDDVAEGGDDE